MVTVVRDEAPTLHAGLDQAGSLGKLLPLAIDLNVDHRDGPDGYFGLRFGGGCGSAHQ